MSCLFYTGCPAPLPPPPGKNTCIENQSFCINDAYKSISEVMIIKVTLKIL